MTSNLRRAAHTAAIAFMDRFERTKEKLFVNDALQRWRRNVDAFALAEMRLMQAVHRNHERGEG